jgi:hypothetical protein
MDQRTIGDRSAFAPPLGSQVAGHRTIAGADSGPESRQDADARPIRIGSEEHKALFCRMLLDTFDPYRPDAVVWPALDDSARQQLCGLPIWDIAVQTEIKASLSVLGYARVTEDALLRQAIALNGFEEARHKQLLAGMLAAYGIESRPEPPYPEPRDREWAFMVTGFSECIDSFFAFGLFASARRSGLFPASLADAFEPVMQEECRHILFFVNWAAWHRRRLPWWRRPLFAARVVRIWLFLVWERIRTARDLGGSNFTMTGTKSVGIDLDVRDLLQLCLAENDKRLAAYDCRLIRPSVMPYLVRLTLRVMAVRARTSRLFDRGK